MSLVIVCRHAMLLGGNSWRRADRRDASTARVPSPPCDGIWVYVAHADTSTLVSPTTLPGAPQWAMMRRMRMTRRRFCSVPVPGTIRVPGRYALHRVADDDVAQAVRTLLERWQARLPVRWQVRHSVPDDNLLPCQWRTAAAPEPRWLGDPFHAMNN